MFQPLGQGEADMAAAVDEHLPHRPGGHVQVGEQPFELGAGAEEVHLVAGKDHRVAGGDGGLAAALDEGDQGLPDARGLAEGHHRAAGQRVAFPDRDAHQGGLVGEELVKIGDLGVQDQVAEVFGGHLVGIDDQLDAQVVFFGEGSVVADVDGLDPGDLLGPGGLPGQQAGDDVGLVVVGHRQEQVRVGHPGVFQQVVVHGVAEQGGDVELGAELVQHPLVGVDGHDVHVFAVQ